MFRNSFLLAAAPQITKSVVITKITQAITAFTSTPATPIVYTAGAGGVGTGTFTVSATGGASANPIVYTTTTATVCTIAANTATILTAGNCTIAANQAGDTNHAAAPQVTLTVAITKLAQTLTNFTSTPATPIPFVFASTFTLSATAGASSSPIAFTSATANVCAIPIGTNTVTILTGGTCTGRANQAADVNYTAAPQLSLSVVITKANQAITGFSPATPMAYPTGGTFTVTATAGASTSPVVYTSATTAVCTAGGTNGATVTMLTIGTCTLRANQAATTSYNAAPQVITTVTIVKGNQTISGVTSAPASPITYTSGGTFTLSATSAVGSSSGNPITYTSTTPTICTTGGTNGATVTMLSAVATPSTCTINANQAGNANYNVAAQVATNITISPPVIATPQIYNIYADHLGTPRAITTSDAAATKVWEWRNDEVFGNNDANEAVDSLNTGVFSYNLRFPGQYLDVETKLHYNYFRDYDSATGRYVQSDPIGLRGGLNTFGYVGLNPLSFVDADGLVASSPGQNCWMYAAGITDAYGSINPGGCSFPPNAPITCAKLIECAKKGGAKDPTGDPTSCEGSKCGEGYRKIWAVATGDDPVNDRNGPPFDYHFYREDEGKWSGKPGSLPPRPASCPATSTHLSPSGRLNYKRNCGALCVQQ